MKQENVLHEAIRKYGRSFINEETSFRVFEMKDFENIMKNTSKLEVAQYAVYSRDSDNTSFCVCDKYFICFPCEKGFCHFRSNGTSNYFISVAEDKLCDEILYLLRSQGIVEEFAKWVTETKINPNRCN